MNKKWKSGWRLKLSSWDRATLESVSMKICRKARENCVESCVVPQPSQRKIFTLLSSPFIYKASRDQYSWSSKSIVIYLSPCDLSIFESVQIPDTVLLIIEPSSSIKNQLPKLKANIRSR